jgi:cell division protein FtsQ
VTGSGTDQRAVPGDKAGQESAPPRPTLEPRIRDRLVAIRREEGRRRLHLLMGAGAVVVSCLLGWGVTRSPLLAVDRVRLSGANHTAVADVVRVVGLAHHRQMVDLDDGVMARAVAALPWVDTARVVRRWPTTVVVTVTERYPVAIVGDTAGWATVDRRGRVLAVTAARPAGLLEARALTAGGSTTPAPPAAGAPGTTVDGAFLTDLTVAVQLGGYLSSRVTAVAVTDDGQLQLALSGGATALLGPPADLVAKLTAVATVVSKVKVGQGTLDVRVPNAPVLTSSGPGQ